MEYGSFINEIFARARKGQPEPEVGMGVTLLSWSDRSPGTIVEVVEKNGKVVMFAVTDDSSVRVDKNGMSECQDYEYSSNMDGPRSWWRLDKKGAWKAVEKNPESGRWVLVGGGGIRLGDRDKYYDYSF